MSKDSVGIWIEVGNKLYALWCFKCARVTESTPSGDGTLRCTVCNLKQAEELDEQLVRAIREQSAARTH